MWYQRSFTLEAAVNVYLAVEKLEKFDCGTCRKAVSATKQIVITSAPSVLCIHLKRFDKNPNKLKDEISFDENLTIQTSDGPSFYELKGMVMHIGETLNWGHYTADLNDRHA